MASDRSFGIDFGTTNSSVARYATYRSVARFTTYDEQNRPIPSVVAIDRSSGKVHTGIDAWERRSALQDSCECISSIKMLLDNEEWSRTIARREWTVIDIATEILRKLKSVADARKANLQVATLAMPVGLSPAARRTLRKAAEYAGIEIESFVSEPTAAFFAYYEELRGSDRVAVFDWGGGTLDVSILRHERGRITELATVGLDVAGDSIDRELASRMHSIIARERGAQVLFEEMDPQDQDNMIVECERAKRALSDADSATISLPRYGDLGAFEHTISYDWFAEVISPIINDAVECLDQAIQQSKSTAAGIDRVVLVGGSSNIRSLREMMRQRFGDNLFFPGDKGWSVSKGAAMLSYAPGAYVTAQDVSIILADGSPYYLLRKGERVARWHTSVEFGITDASQTLRIVFSGSEDINADETRHRLLEVKGYGFLEEKLVLEAWIDEDLVFNVRMKSSMRPDRDAEVWHYDRLKLSYDIGGWA